MYLRKLEIRTGDNRPVPIAWLDSFSMRNFTSEARFDDTLPAADGLLEAGLQVPLAELREAMEGWFRRKGWLRPEEHLLLREREASH